VGRGIGAGGAGGISVCTAGHRVGRRGARTRREALTAREFEVLGLIARGQSNKLIARALDLSLHTVKRHVANTLAKLGAASRGQAAAWFHAQQPPANA
jgi:LuxR family maltose regulon positive regulatory protein